jgi:hypothetical protein
VREMEAGQAELYSMYVLGSSHTLHEAVPCKSHAIQTSTRTSSSSPPYLQMVPLLSLTVGSAQPVHVPVAAALDPTMRCVVECSYFSPRHLSCHHAMRLSHVLEHDFELVLAFVEAYYAADRPESEPRSCGTPLDFYTMTRVQQPEGIPRPHIAGELLSTRYIGISSSHNTPQLSDTTPLICLPSTVPPTDGTATQRQPHSHTSAHRVLSHPRETKAQSQPLPDRNPFGATSPSPSSRVASLRSARYAPSSSAWACCHPTIPATHLNPLLTLSPLVLARGL